mmetsp:Transcript_17282/g.41954  ORF Transcript_17282/g.41954 Transcript_17282/m.41954 type:complete len:587 (+) Transcript_17282:42-1802(+)
MRGHLLLFACIALHLLNEAAAQPQFEIFEPLAGAEYAKDQEIVLSFKGTDFPKNDKRAELHLNKLKLRELPLPKEDGEVFNVTLTGVKKGRHEFDVILFYGADPLKQEVLDVWGSFFFVGSETARLSTKLNDSKKKAGSKEWAADSMMTWVTSKGGDVEKLTVKEDGERGVGLFTSTAVRRGEVIAEIPFSSTLGPESASKNMYSEFLLTLYSDKDFPAQFANAVHLLCELQQDSSSMSAWIKTLPPFNDDSLGVAISWDRHDHMRANRLLPMLTKTAHDQQDFFDRGYERLWAVLDMYEKQFKKLKKQKKMPKLSLFTRGNMMWAMSVVLTRAWRCPNEPEVKFEGYSHRPGLYRVAPPTDAINFLSNGYLPYPSVPRESHGHIVITVNNTEAKVRVIALEEMAKDTQIFLHVGDMANHELMVQYGYITKPNLMDPELLYPDWVPGVWLDEMAAEQLGQPSNSNMRSCRLATIAPGADPVAFAKFLNLSIAEQDYDDEKKMNGLRSAMDELFEAAITLVPHGGENERKVCLEGTTPEQCKAAAEAASKLVQDAEYTARVMMTEISSEVSGEVEGGWEAVRKALGV